MPAGFFKHIPSITYDFKSDGKFYEAKDMFRKVSTWSYLQEGVTGYSYYRIIEGERPDVVATNLYGDATLYWLFFLVNENLQDLSDWPKSQSLFNKYIDRKYSGTCLKASTSTDIVSYDHSKPEDEQLASRKFVLGEKVSQSSSVFGFVTDVNPTHNRITLNNVTGTFTANGTATGATSGKSFTISSVVDEKDAVNHYTSTVVTYELTYDAEGEEIIGDEILTHTFRTTVPTGNTVVTNVAHELTLNDEKHLIRYIEPQFTGRVINEFIDLMGS